jgi:hypothetical protein
MYMYSRIMWGACGSKRNLNLIFSNQCGMTNNENGSLMQRPTLSKNVDSRVCHRVQYCKADVHIATSTQPRLGYGGMSRSRREVEWADVYWS